MHNLTLANNPLHTLKNLAIHISTLRAIPLCSIIGTRMEQIRFWPQVNNLRNGRICDTVSRMQHGTSDTGIVAMYFTDTL